MKMEVTRSSTKKLTGILRAKVILNEALSFLS